MKKVFCVFTVFLFLWLSASVCTADPLLPENAGFPGEIADFSVYEKQELTIMKSLSFSGEFDDFVLDGVERAFCKDTDGTAFVRLTSGINETGSGYFDVSAREMAKEKLFIVDFRVRVNQLERDSAFHVLSGQNLVGKWRKGYTLQSDGTVVSSEDRRSKTSYQPGNWVRLSYCFNTVSGEIYLYKNGQFLKAEAMGSEVLPIFVRFELESPMETHASVDIDYVRIYTGTTLQKDDAFSETAVEIENMDIDFEDTKMGKESDVLSLLEDATVLMTTNQMMFWNKKKIPYDDESYAAIEVEQKPMLPVKLIAKLTGSEVKYNEVINSISVGGTTVNLTTPSVERNGAWYVSLEEIAEPIFKKMLTWDGRGCAILADKVYEVQQDPYRDKRLNLRETELIYRYMQYENPTGYEMISALKQNMPQKTHPRLLHTMDEVYYMLDKIDSDAEWYKGYQALLASARLELGKDNTSKYHPTTGSRQTDARALQDSLEILGRTYLLTGDSRYAKKSIEILEALVEWETVDYGTSNLTCGHWMAAIAIGYDTFYNYLMSVPKGEELLSKMRSSAYQLVIKPHCMAYANDYDLLHYITLMDNFAGVSGGGLMALLIALGDEEDYVEETAYLLENNLKTLEMAAVLCYPNGGYYESVGYSQYYGDNFSLALIGMKNAFHNYYGLDLTKGFAEMGYSLTFLQSPIACVNYHDGSTGYVSDPIREKWAYLFDDPNQAALAKRQKALRGQAYSLEELFYYTKAVEGKEDRIDLDSFGTDAYFYSTETGAFSSSMEVSTPTFVGYHGGWTNIPHDMLDLGEFWFESEGIRWACDLGSDSYNIPRYFAREGYKLYRKRPEGKNCIMLNPRKDPEYFGQKLDARAELILLEQNKPKGAMAAYDLTDAYERDVKSYIRGYYFGDDRNTLIVQDELKLKESTEFYWFMHTQQEIEILSNTQARLKSANGKSVLVDVSCSDSNYTLDVMEAVPIEPSHVTEGVESNKAFRKLVIHGPNFSGDVTVAVKFSPENDSYDYTSLQVTPINEWQIPDGEKTPTPKLKSISYNGVVSEQEIAGLREFTLVLPYGTTEAPVISAEADIGEVVVKRQPVSLEDSVEISVFGDNMRTANILVHLEVSQEKPIFVTDNLHQIDPIINRTASKRIMPVTASQKLISDEGNLADHLLDGNIDTRCAQYGEDVWFELDYGQVHEAKGVAISYYLGDQRKLFMDILYSTDGEHYEKVYSGTSSGKTLELELYEIPAQVRYVRIVANGTTEGNLWASLTEVQLYQ